MTDSLILFQTYVECLKIAAIEVYDLNIFTDFTEDISSQITKNGRKWTSMTDLEHRRFFTILSFSDTNSEKISLAGKILDEISENLASTVEQEVENKFSIEALGLEHIEELLQVIDPKFQYSSVEDTSQIFRLRENFKVFNEALLAFLQKLIELERLFDTSIGQLNLKFLTIKMVKIDNSCLGSVSAALTIFVKISGVSSFKNSLKARAFIQIPNIFNRKFQEIFCVNQFGHKRCRHRLHMGDKRPPSADT